MPMNPLHPHNEDRLAGKTDSPAGALVNRGLKGLVQGGQAKKWRASLLEKHRLEAVIQMTGYPLQPYTSAATVIVYLRSLSSQGRPTS